MTKEVKLTMLGTSDAIPNKNRNHPAFLITYDGENILVDCGEGTQRQFRKAGLNPCKLTKLLITHWHGDHVLGIPGILQTLAFSGYNKTLDIYGPKGTKKFMSEVLKTFVFSGKIKFNVHEILKEGKFFENGEFFLETKFMTHGVPCNAYSFVLKGNLRIDKKKLSKLKIPFGSHLQELKRGKNIVHSGKNVKFKDVTFREDDKKISIVMDTVENKNIVPLVKDSDILVIESTFEESEEKFAREYKHMTCVQSAKVAKKAKVKKLILTHVSQRYQENPKKILNEAKKVFKNVFMPKDLDNFVV